MSYNSLMDFTSTHELTLSEYHPTLFNVTLCDEFDKSISAGELNGLLQEILECFRHKFTEVYGATAKWEENYDALENYDYIQQVDILQEKIEQRAGYAREMDYQAPTFRYEGKGFSDISVAYNSLIDSGVMHVNSIISVYLPSKNPVRLYNQYSNAINELDIELEAKEKEMENLNSLISSYEKNETIYLGNSYSVEKIDGNSEATYNALVEKQKAIADEITDINSRKGYYQHYINVLTGNEAKNSKSTDEDASKSSSQVSSPKIRQTSAAQIATVEREIADLDTEIENIWGRSGKMLEAYTDQELNEQTVRDTNLRYDKPSILSGAFIKKAIMTAGPFVAIGFIICMSMLLIIVIREEKERNRLAEENM
jgi:hypothetical protein